MKITFHLLAPFCTWIDTKTLELEFQEGETLGQIIDRWVEAHPHFKQIFAQKNAYKDNHLYALYMCNWKFYKSDHKPENGQVYTMMSTMIGG